MIIWLPITATYYNVNRPFSQNFTSAEYCNIIYNSQYNNVSVASRMSLPHISAILVARRISLFGHVARIGERVPACSALGLAVDIRSGIPPTPSWKRPWEHPCCRWLDPFVHDSAVSVSARRSDAVNRGHSSLAQHPSAGHAMK